MSLMCFESFLALKKIRLGVKLVKSAERVQTLFGFDEVDWERILRD